MSKKYFINKVDSLLGEVLLQELVKGEEEGGETSIMGSFVDAKREDPPLKGMKKILKRYKPKLFRKKLLEECDTMIYSIEDVDDIRFGIECLKWQAIEENKTMVVISNVLSWGGQKSNMVRVDMEVDATEQSETASQKKLHDLKKTDGDEEEEEEEEEDKEEEEEDKEGEQGEGEGEDKGEGEEVKENGKGKKTVSDIKAEAWREEDYKERVPLNKEKYLEQKRLEDELLSLEIVNVKVIIVGSGMQYGYKEQTLEGLVEAAWRQSPQCLCYLENGENLIAAIHVKDLARLIIQKTCETSIGDQKYVLGVDDSPIANRTMKAIVQALSNQIGTGKVKSVQRKEDLQVKEEFWDYFTMDIDFKLSKLLGGGGPAGGEEELDQGGIEWRAQKGITQNVQVILNEFNQSHTLRPLNLHIISQPDCHDLKQKHILDNISAFYRIPVITIDQILNDLMDKDNFKPELTLLEDYVEHKHQIDILIKEGQKDDSLTEPLKVLVRIVKWRLQQNDCRNRGSILYNYPLTPYLASLIFKTQKPNLLKKKEKKEDKKKEKKVTDGDEEEDQEAEQEQEQEQEQEEGEGEGEGEGEEFKSKNEVFCPETVVVLKKFSSKQLYKPKVESFYRSIKLDVYMCDSSEKDIHENIENIMINIERNGRPNNYLEEESSVTEKHLEYYLEVDRKTAKGISQAEEEKLKRETQQHNAKETVLQNQLKLIAGEEHNDYDNNFRQYLIANVIPQMQEALLEVSEMRPKDPIDFLAQILYQKSYDI